MRTGEEEEEVVLTERCKLFRWDDSQWKERGIGDMKILRHVITGKSRLLMRREQVSYNLVNSNVLNIIPSVSSMRSSYISLYSWKLSVSCWIFEHFLNKRLGKKLEKILILNKT